MHSIMFIFKRKKTMSLEEFYYHYEHIHGTISKRLEGLIEYRQHTVRPSGKGDGAYAPEASEFDAVSIYTFESADAAEKAWISAVGIELERDTQKLIDTESMLTLPVNLRIVKNSSSTLPTI